MRLDSNSVVTVFGGTGFIGKSLVRRLAATGARIRVATRKAGDADVLRMAGSVGQVVALPYNPADEAQLRAAVTGADAVVNLVGILAETRRSSFQDAHVTLAGRIAAASAAAGVQRLLHLSAIGASPTSKSAYGRSKASGEDAVRRAFPRATVIRPSLVFGPEDGFFNLFGRLARVSPMLPVYGGGKTRFQPVYVGDVAEAMLHMLEDERTASRTYELGGPAIYTFREIVELVLQTVQRDRVIADFSWGVARMQAGLFQKLPGKLLTRDQVASLQVDNVVNPGALGLKELGVQPTAVESIVPSYLSRFRPGGQFAQQHGSA